MNPNSDKAQQEITCKCCVQLASLFHGEINNNNIYLTSIIQLYIKIQVQWMIAWELKQNTC